MIERHIREVITREDMDFLLDSQSKRSLNPRRMRRLRGQAVC
jgi:hypothetical protein